MAAVDSDYSTTIEATIESIDWWIHSVDNPTTGVMLSVMSSPLSMNVPGAQATYTPLSRARKVLIEEENILGAEFNFEVDTIGDEAFQALTTLRESRTVLLLRSPTGEQWYVKFVQNTWAVSLLNVVSRWRQINFDMIEVDVPS